MCLRVLLPVVLWVIVALQQQVSDVLRWVQTMKFGSVPPLQPADAFTDTEREDVMNDSVMWMIKTMFGSTST